MAKNKSSLAEVLSDRFTDVWKLLSDTTSFLSRTPEFHHYEEQLRSLRSELQKTQNSETAQKIRKEITDLRKALRFQGYDLSLGAQTLTVDQFRNDASLKDGFKRVVIFLTNSGIVWLGGEENHIMLADYLEARIQNNLADNHLSILGKHYLWYRRRGNELILSGSDTETKEDFARLQEMAEANSLFLLGQLKNLK
ncbi:MAG: hypothetical protein LBV20_02060 [Treponema sp.]|jgi:hypothetical protein|nr:hypothetical protein [Treponema sp.]